ncbi:cysteine synthase A [bacterium]|nr:cysteine synthase A [bacterium]
MNILKTIGNTPLIELVNFSPEGRHIFAKLEGENPGGSIKDRIAVSMVESGERNGSLRSGGTIIEPTSGNTGIGLAMVAAAKGYRCIIVMPENMSEERRKILRYFGAEVILTPAEKGMLGAIEKAGEIAENTENSFMPDQFSNPANPSAHRENTGPEIYDALGFVPDAFVAGVGTGGTIIGVAQYFKLDISADIEIVAVEPSESAVLSGGEKGAHNIQGIGAGFVPPMFDAELIDRIVQISSDEATDMTKELARKCGIAAGISSGANLAAAIKIAQKMPADSSVVTVFPDKIDRYLSIL